ncbi:response regulator transcription factor [Patulibacter minatonensis]|uniref:response regulator transcription factor n=1 Tax=Patulibacter minatonensis TaxID=298163 RepID=UPI000479E3C8|nr:response regulator transcription factor [Patulibacter minatonensis]
MHVLVVEDDQRLADVLRRGLQEADHHVQVRHDGLEGLALVGTERFDVVVLDWMLPGLDGPSMVRAMRERGDRTPVLMLTARHAVPDRIGGLDAGADDYLAKPFSFDELLARLRAIGRRTGHGELLTVGDVTIDRDRRAVVVAGATVDLTAREFALLLLLAERAGRIVSRMEILDAVWDGNTDLRSNAIDVHVARLRGKVDRPFGRESIETVRGIGFRLTAPQA